MSDSLQCQNDAKNQDAQEYMESLIDDDRNLSSPAELLVKFLTHLMTKDYEQALAYCSEILRNEPQNPTALEFYPLIMEKLELMKEGESLSESSSLSSSSSSLSDNMLYANESLNSTQEKCSPEREGGVTAGHTIKNSISNPLGRKSEKKTMRDLKSSVSLEGKRDRKNSSNEYLNTKLSESEANTVLVHPTQTRTIVGKGVVRQLSNPNQEHQALTALCVEIPSKTVQSETEQ